MPTENVTTMVGQEQTVRQEASVATLYEQVEDAEDLTGEEQEEIRQLIDDYKDELEKESPDKSRIKQLVQSVKDRSPDVAASMIALALQQHGPALLDVLSNAV